MYEVHLSQKADKFLNKCKDAERILSKLKNLSDNPVPSDAKFIVRNKRDKVFRIRIGNFRALYKVKENQKIVLISKIDKRPKVYHR